MAYPIGGAASAAASLAAANQRRQATPKPGVSGARDDGSLAGPGGPRPRPARPAVPSAAGGGVSTDDVAGGAPPTPSPAAPPKRPAWQMLREAGVQATGSAAGNRAAAAGLPGYGMEKPMPTERPAVQPPVSLPGVPPEIAGRIAQIAQERGVGGGAQQDVLRQLIARGGTPGNPGPAAVPGMSELPLPSSPDPMATHLGGFYPSNGSPEDMAQLSAPSMSKPLPPAGGAPGSGNPWEGIALASLRSRGLQGINGGGLQGGPAPAYGDPGFLDGRPETGHLGGGAAGLGMIRDPRMLRDLGERGGLGSF